ATGPNKAREDAPGTAHDGQLPGAFLFPSGLPGVPHHLAVVPAGGHPLPVWRKRNGVNRTVLVLVTQYLRLLARLQAPDFNVAEGRADEHFVLINGDRKLPVHLDRLPKLAVGRPSAQRASGFEKEEVLAGKRQGVGTTVKLDVQRPEPARWEM